MDNIKNIVQRAYSKGKQKQTFDRYTTGQIIFQFLDYEAKIIELEAELEEMRVKYRALKQAVINKFVEENSDIKGGTV